MNSFFLSRLLPPNTEGSAEQSEAIGASLRTQVRTFNTCTLCLDSSLWVNFLLFHYSHSEFYNRSRMTGRYLILFCKKLSAVSAPTCPFRRLRRHLSQDKASHTLLQRRSAPRKVVRLLPDSGDGLRFACFPYFPIIRGRLTFSILSFWYDSEEFFENVIHSCRHSWAVASMRKELKYINKVWMGAKNPA